MSYEIRQPLDDAKHDFLITENKPDEDTSFSYPAIGQPMW